MKKFKFLGLFLALSLIFSNVTLAQITIGGNTTVTRIAGGSSGNVSVSLCSTFVCLQPYNYPGPGSHMFAMAPADLISILIGYGTGGFFVYRFAVDAAPGYYVQSNSTNTLLIRKTGLGSYEFIII